MERRVRGVVVYLLIALPKIQQRTAKSACERILNIGYLNGKVRGKTVATFLQIVSCSFICVIWVAQQVEVAAQRHCSSGVIY